MNNSFFNRHKKSMLRGLFVLGLLVICLTLLSLSSKAISKQLYAWNLLPKPETFTELYFENHTNLPTQVEPQQAYSFAFTVHNLEYKNMHYPYEVFLQEKSKKIIVTKGDISLLQDKKKTVPVQFSIPAVIGQTEVVVLLPTKQQQIDFWVNK